MAPKKSNPSNPSKNVMHFVKKIREKIKNFWDSLIDSKTFEDSATRRLRNCRNSIVVWAVCTVFMAIAWLTNYYRHVTGTFTVMSIWLLLESMERLHVTASARVERERFEDIAFSNRRRITIIVIIFTILSVLVKQNVLGIGKASTDTFPWLGKAASSWITFINKFVEEFKELVNNSF